MRRDCEIRQDATSKERKGYTLKKKSPGDPQAKDNQ